MDTDILKEFLYLRKNSYDSNIIRDKFVLFREYIHDYIRTGKIEKLHTPLSVSWAITYQCNLQCEHCYAKKDKVKELTLEKCQRVIDKLLEWNCLDISFEGGEPLIKKEFFDILKYAKRNNFIVDILTNGILLNQENNKKLEESIDDIDRIQISLDGWRTQNDIIRGNNSYDIVLGNLMNLSGLKNVTINTVVTKNNVNTLDKMVADLLKYTDVKKIHFSPLMAFGKGINNEKPPIDTAVKKYMQIQKKFGSKIDISGTPIPDLEFLSSPEYFEFLDNEILNYIHIGCCAGRSKIHITPDGNTASCTFITSKSNLKYLFDLQWDLTETWKEIRERAYRDSKRINRTKCFEEYCLAKTL